MGGAILASRIFTVAGIYGLCAMVPLYFTEGMIGVNYPPKLTHVEYYYGFIGLAICWQLGFLLIGKDPMRYRPFMVIAVLEKCAFSGAAIALFLQGRLIPLSLLGGTIDVVLGTLFIFAFRATAQRE